MQEIASNREIVTVPASTMLSLIRELKVLRYKVNTAGSKISRLKSALRKTALGVQLNGKRLDG